jgi:poly-beta-hydroxyalkanoate depolymerase
MARAQPPASAAIATMMPIGPAPSTMAVSPGEMPALVAACMPTANGSTIAPSAKLTLSGSLNV